VFRIFVWIVVLVGGAVCILPFLVSLTSSFMPPESTSRYPPSLWSPEWTLANYTVAWNAGGFSSYLTNTVIYAVVTGVSATLTSALGGYTFARLRFPGRDKLFMIILAVMMVPGAVTLVPLFYVLVRWPLVGGNNILGQGGRGFYDTWWGLVLPGLFGPGTIFLMRQFFKTLPRELEDAARIDGCSEIGIWWRIAMPLSKPALITVLLLQFSESWNAYMWPLVIARSPRLYTLQVGLQVFATHTAAQYVGYAEASGPGLQQAGAILTMLPIVVLFVAGQRYFTRGIQLTGFK
jgi:multiple sugar transport system permease protein